MSFASPLFLVLLLVIPFLVFWVNLQYRKGAIRYSNTTLAGTILPTWKTKWIRVMPWLTVTALIMMIIALARPQFGLPESLVRREGIDIVLALDVSTSMLAEDFQIAGQRINRIDIVKQVTKDFIDKRPNDRIGIVIFAGRPYILSPLTWDHDWVKTRLTEVKAGMIEDSTAIGSALATSVNRLQASKAKSKVVILLTDGMNNAGEIMPETAAQAAQALNVKIYTIGAGSKDYVPYPVKDQWGQKAYQMIKIDLDEELLQNIATTTGGQYFRATDTNSLTKIFRQIDRMEKTTIEMPHFREYRDLYPHLLTLAVIILLGETILTNTLLRRLP